MTIPQHSDNTIRILRDFFKISLDYYHKRDVIQTPCMLILF